MTVETTITQGEAWGLGMTLADGSGNPISVAGATIAGRIRDEAGSLVQQLSFVLGGATGAFSTGVVATSAWPAGRLIGQIEIVIGGVAFIPPPFRINVSRSILA